MAIDPGPSTHLEPSPLRLFVVRHGETEWSRSGRHTGRTDLPLDEGGRRHAVAMRDRLGAESIDRAFSSPLVRALETAELAGFANVAKLPELMEWDYGDYEGRTSAEIRADRPDWDLFTEGCPGGESPAEIGARADRAIAIIRTAGNDGNSVVFAHGHLIRVLAMRWLGLPTEHARHLLFDPGLLGVLTEDRGTPVISSWNS